MRSGGAGGQNVNKGAPLQQHCHLLCVTLSCPDLSEYKGGHPLRGAPRRLAARMGEGEPGGAGAAGGTERPILTHYRHQERNRVNSEGELVVNSSRHRTQKQNYEDALEKLQEMIDTAATPPAGASQQTIAKVKAHAKRSNERRLDDKKRESSRKADRRSKDFD